jgi:hypothetical protein
VYLILIKPKVVYIEVFGFNMIRDVEFVADDSLMGMAAKEIHGPNLKNAYGLANFKQSSRI